MKKIAIIGGVAGGASAAARLRRLDENVEIILFEKGEYISFANCGLPYYIGDTIKNRDSLLLQTPEKLKQRFNIDVRVNSEVIKVSPKENSLTVSNNGKEYNETFDYLILSPGAKPIVPNIPGINNSKIFTLRNMNDMDKIKNYIIKNNISNIAVIGGGYIGVETAENLSNINIATTIIEANKTILNPFDKEISNIVVKELIENGVSVLTEHKVIKFEDKGTNLVIYFENGKKLETEMVISAIGVTPDTEFLKESGILLGEKGDILINEFLQTNFNNIYALGDATFSKNLITNKTMFSALAGPANRQGRIVANNILGTPSKYSGGISTAILKIFSLSAGSTGINENIAKISNIPYGKIYLHPADHASYYPGGTPITIKVLYHKENHKILGAQAIGAKGIDKFIDVIATTIKFGGTFEDLEELELCYAPPYSSAKSPANMVGFIGENIEEKLVEQVYIEDIENYPNSIILDVREEIELVSGSFKNSLNIPLTQLRSKYKELDKTKEYLVYCAIGLRGYIATRFLKQNGFKVKNIAGGFNLFNRGNLKSLNNLPHKIEKINIENNKNIIDLSGLSCPGPLAKVKEFFDNAKESDIATFRASDPGFYNDIQAWCSTTKNELINLSKNDNEIIATIKKKLV